MAQTDAVQWLEILSAIDRLARLEGAIRLLLETRIAFPHAMSVEDAALDTERLLATGLEQHDLRRLTHLLNLINVNRRSNAAQTIADLDKPRWNRSGRRLWWCGELVKEFHVAAYSQECILDRFEEQGWPTHVDDPLPKADATTAKRRLRAAIQNLNRKQLQPLIHFQGNGRGTGVCWELTQATHDNRIQLSTQ